MLDIHGRNIELIDTKDNLHSLCVDTTLLHSKYYPKTEAEKFISKYSKLFIDKDVIVVYGLALGYHIKELLKAARANSIVKIFDLDQELFKVTCHEEVIKEILKDNRVVMNIGYSENILIEFSRALKEVEDIIIYKPSIRVLPKMFDEFKDSLERYEIGKIAIEKFSNIMLENEKFNLNNDYRNIKDFLNNQNLKNKPILIVSAGPSLDSTLEDIKRIRDKVTIFAVGSALKTLISYEIKPDMFCIIDPQEIVYEQIRGLEELDIPLCFFNTASYKSVSSYRGPKYIFYNEEREYDTIVIDTGKSVATAIISIALKTGCNPIILTGQDLAFLNNKTHCNNYPHSEDTVYDSSSYKKVIGVEGKLLNTTPGLLYFKNWIETAIKENPKISFVNCSKGARIKGTLEMKLEEAINIANLKFSK
jgi:hypothetical protein